MRIFKQLLLLVAGLLASSLSLEAISGGGLGQNPHPAVLVSGQPQQCGQFHHFHSGSFHMGNRHFVPMHNRHFIPIHRINRFEVIRGSGFSDQRFGSRHVHFVRQFDPRTGQFVIREFVW
ncbi:hypothetical protein [Pseudomonas sp. A-B-19]|uniref:hypothetical protein n=1 Tax=Pseudomonas sp. A-B-19 TaxID=2832405 RepID=UPI001CBF787F|nr:hypothetical protein [Pseudomonas sp. A-B-19]